MMRRAIAFLAAVTCLDLASAARAAAPLTSPALIPSIVLEHYAASLAALKHPKALSFDYQVEQLGLHDMEQTHHVYRSGLHERDETIVVDGFTLPRPAVRILANRSDRYDIGAVAPTPAGYTFKYSGVVLNGENVAYVFGTEPRSARSFAVSEVVIDGHTFLPNVVRFKLAGYGAHGSGELVYGPADVFWLVRQAQVNAHLTSGALTHERIVWSNYQFPSALPPSTFEAPRPTTVLEPEDLATPTPVPDPDSP
jgi:hypothetical protein